MTYIWLLAFVCLSKGGKGYDFWSSTIEKQEDRWVRPDDANHAAYRYHTAPEERTKPPSKQPDSEPNLYETYEGEPATWPCFYKHCGGKRQSPINIDTTIIQFKSELGPLSFHNYELALENLLIINGGRIIVQIPKDSNILVRSKWFKSTYRLYKMLFLWQGFGSSHTVDSKHFPMELILSHINTKYDDPQVDEPDAILDLNVFFKISKEHNEALNPIIETFPRINNQGDNTTITRPIKMVNYLPEHLDAYVTYNGSRSIPLCKETRRFIIFDYTSNISKQQLQQFNMLASATEANLKPGEGKSFRRPIQALNNREIWGSIPFSVPKKQHTSEHSKQNYQPWEW